MYTPEKVEKMAEVIQTPTLATSIRRECAAMLRAYAATLKAAQGGVTDARTDTDFTLADLKAVESIKVGEVLTAKQWEAELQFVRHQDEIIRNLQAALSAQQGQGEAVAWTLRFWGITDRDALGPINTATTFPSEWKANQYADQCAVPDICDRSPKRPVVVPLYLAPPAQPAERVPEDTGRIDWMEANARSVSFGKAPTQGYWVHVQGIGYSGGSNRSLREAIDAARKAQAASPAPSPARGDGDAAARQLYIDSQGDAHNLHTLAWSELSEAQRNKWREKATQDTRP